MPKAPFRQDTVHFPREWNQIFNRVVPDWVKQTYAPASFGKNIHTPFNEKDAAFFGRGVRELSRLFTTERSEQGRRRFRSYFEHARFRSAYLLYFLPLHAAKFLTLFQIYPKAFDAAVEQGRKTGVIRIADLGSGPGTASIAFLVQWINRFRNTPSETLPRFEFHWFDVQNSVLRDGERLFYEILAQFPALRERVTLHLYPRTWTDAPRIFTKVLEGPLALSLLGNVLNEPAQNPGAITGAIRSLHAQTAGGGVLMLEPALKPAAQRLSQIRDRLLEEGALSPTPASIWGPCLHAGRCPLASGRDWCHFSVPVAVPGKWFRAFSRMIGSEREWVKFSYLWIASKEFPAPLPAAGLRRVVSDPIRRPSGADVFLICEPERPVKMPIPRPQKHPSPGRGELIRIRSSQAKKKASQ